MNKNMSPEWNKFLDPKNLKRNLIRCSIFITAWEILKDSIIDQIMAFYTNGYKNNKRLLCPDYHAKVLSLDTREKKDPLLASILWLKQSGVINDEDHKMFDEIRSHRNFIVHELPKVILDPGIELNLNLHNALNDLVAKIDRWWILEVEIPTNPDFTSEDYDHIDRENVMSGRMIFLGLLNKVAYEDDDALTELYREYIKRQ